MDQQPVELEYYQQLAVVQALETCMEESNKRDKISEGKKDRGEISNVRYCNDRCVECNLREEIREKLTGELRKLATIAKKGLAMAEARAVEMMVARKTSAANIC